MTAEQSQSTEFIPGLARFEPVYREEEDAFSLWLVRDLWPKRERTFFSSRGWMGGGLVRADQNRKEMLEEIYFDGPR